MLYAEIKVRIKGPSINSDAEFEANFEPVDQLDLRDMIRSTVQQKLDELDMEFTVEVN